MKAIRLHRYNEQPLVEEVAEPKIAGPHDVIVRIGYSCSLMMKFHKCFVAAR